MDYKFKILIINKHLTAEVLNKIKYLLKDEIGEGELEKCTTFLELARAMEKLNIISPENMERLLNILEFLNKQDIIEMLEKPHLQKRGLQGKELSYFADRIGSQWNRLARYCGLDEASIDVIDNDYRYVQAKAMQTFKVWIERNGTRTWADLKTILYEMERRDLIGDYERQLSCII